MEGAADRYARVLVIKWGALGDLIAGTTALRALRDHLPEAHLTVIANSLMFQICPPGTLVDEVIPYTEHRLPAHQSLLEHIRLVRRLRRSRFDVAVNLRWTSERSAILTRLSGAPIRVGSGPSSLAFLYTVRAPLHQGRRHEFHRNLDILKPLGIVPHKILPFVYCSRDDMEFAGQWFSTSGLPGSHTIGIHPGASKPSKAWPPEFYCECARRLGAVPGLRLLVTWGPGERELGERVVAAAGTQALLAPETTRIPALAALIKSCRLFLCNYSGPMNVAMAVETPLVALGSSSPEDWGPYGDLHRTINKSGRNDSYTDEQQMEMMRQISVEEVVAMVMQRLGELSAEFRRG